MCMCTWYLSFLCQWLLRSVKFAQFWVTSQYVFINCVWGNFMYVHNTFQNIKIWKISVPFVFFVEERSYANAVCDKYQLCVRVYRCTSVPVTWCQVVWKPFVEVGQVQALAWIMKLLEDGQYYAHGKLNACNTLNDIWSAMSITSRKMDHSMPMSITWDSEVLIYSTRLLILSSSC